MAEGLGIARYTVRNHVAALYCKLGVSRQSALVVLARELPNGSAATQRGRKNRAPSSDEP
ncbi:hypothetical protein [Methylobacterium oryzisoli]|uniref:hypothetical protein n=1 Tax=Methylobacterium oryzisoli TaxID=3385502 RepID=UPI003891FBC1